MSEEKIKELRRKVRTGVLVVVLIVLTAFFYLDQSCTSSDKLQQEIGAHEQLKKEMKAARIVYHEENKQHEEEKKILQGNIETLTRDIQANDQGDERKEEELEELEVEEPGLVDKDKLIVNLRKQNALLRDRLGTALFNLGKVGKPIFTLLPSGEEIVTYPSGSITDSLNKKYLEQVEITKGWIKIAGTERKGRIGAEDLATKAIKNASRIRLISDIKTAGVVVFGGYIVYSIFFKK